MNVSDEASDGNYVTPYQRGARVIHRTMGPATVYQDRDGDTSIHITPDNKRGIVVAVRERDLWFA